MWLIFLFLYLFACTIHTIFRTGAVNSAAGSAYAESGKTKVIVSVFGPKESKKAMMYSDTGRLNCNVTYTTFATTVRGHGSENKEFSTMLHNALEGAIVLESFPKTTVDVFALVLESGGSDLPVVISCASLALADAGITMYDLVAGASVREIRKFRNHFEAVSSKVDCDSVKNILVLVETSSSTQFRKRKVFKTEA
ncbi:hypothetical protein OIU76_030453 [Salix suchowensis]|nr:hypothetical protein OIU76_030453 [Salix suchowensis]